MKKLFTPKSLLLYVLTILVFLVGGSVVAALTGAGKNQGLAGGAIVLFYGVISAFIALIISLLIAYKANDKTIVAINKILGIICLIIVSYFVYKRITVDEKKENPVKEVKPLKPTAPAAILFKTISYEEYELPQQNSESPIGMGFFKPNFYEHPVLYFYGNLNLEKSVMEHPPYDSVTFKRTEYGEFEIATAPPWLVPDHLKLDYGILFFRIQSVNRDFVEITVNTKSSRTTFVNRNDGTILYWPEFLLKVHSVEFILGKEQTVRVKPLDFAGEEITSFQFMRSIVIKGNWMKVELQDGDFKKVGDGWIRWRDEEQLLIKYSLLS